MPSDQNHRVTLSDLDGLPKELIDALSVSDSDRKDFAIIEAIKSVGGIASIDKMMIALYKQTGKVHDRGKLMARLYRMKQKQLIFDVENHKGVYTTAKEHLKNVI